MNVLEPALVSSQELIVGTFPAPSFEIGHGRRIYATEIGKYYKLSVSLSSAAAAAAKSLQSRPTLCNPTDGSPPGSPVPGILQARTLEWVAISFSNA